MECKIKILEPKPGVKLLAVKVPEGAFELEVMGNIVNVSTVKNHFQFNNSIQLPKGNWQILGLSTEIPEEVCEEFTPYEYDGRDDPNIEGFIYECFYESALTCSTAKESFLSYLISQGVEENSLILKAV